MLILQFYIILNKFFFTVAVQATYENGNFFGPLKSCPTLTHPIEAKVIEDGLEVVLKQTYYYDGVFSFIDILIIHSSRIKPN